MKKIILFLLFIVRFSMADSSWVEKSVKVEAGSQIQLWIDQIYEEVLADSSRVKLVCSLFLSDTDLSFSLGVSQESATKIYNQCGSQKSSRFSKVLKKTFYIVPEAHLDFESWTDTDNRTFLFLDESSSFDDLKIRLVHELAMTYDAKMNIMYTTYLALERPRIQISNYRSLQIAFNKSLWYPVSRSFAALRAYQLENQLIDNRFDKMTHAQCVKNFMLVFSHIKQIVEPKKSKLADQFAMGLADMANIKMMPQGYEDENAFLNMLLDESLRVPTHEQTEVSFCQYMSQPLLSPISLHTFFAHGPRPRVTGGSGGQGGQLTTSPSFKIDSLDSRSRAFHYEVMNIKKDLSLKRDQMPPKKAFDKE